jgi:energy-coupling factor transporter ATP-binding protein EcfA2
MISSFIYKERIVNLVPIPVREQRAAHIYKSNSVTLIVGPNNSGKTDLLSRLSHIVASGEESEVESDVSLLQTAVVYFSPAPFKKSRFPHRRKRIKVVAPSATPPKFSDSLLRDLQERFGFTATIKVRLKFPPIEGIRALLSQAMEIPQRIPSFEELYGATKKYQEASIAWRGAGSENTSGNTERQRQMQDAQAGLKLEIENLVRQRLGVRESVYLAALAFLAQSEKKDVTLSINFGGHCKAVSGVRKSWKL